MRQRTPCSNATAPFLHPQNIPTGVVVGIHLTGKVRLGLTTLSHFHAWPLESQRCDLACF